MNDDAVKKLESAAAHTFDTMADALEALARAYKSIDDPVRFGELLGVSTVLRRLAAGTRVKRPEQAPGKPVILRFGSKPVGMFYCASCGGPFDGKQCPQCYPGEDDA